MDLGVIYLSECGKHVPIRRGSVKDPTQHTSGRRRSWRGWDNRRFLEPVRASYGDDRVWEFRNRLELVKESEAWDGGQQPGKKLGFKHRSAEGAGDTTGRARFEDSASEEGTTGRTRARTSWRTHRGEPGSGLQYWFFCAHTCRRAAELSDRRSCTSSTIGRGNDREHRKGASVGGTDRRSARTARPGNPREPGFYWRSLETPGQVKARHIVLLSDFWKWLSKSAMLQECRKI